MPEVCWLLLLFIESLWGLLGVLVFGDPIAFFSMLLLGALLLLTSLLGAIPFFGPYFYWLVSRNQILPMMGLPPNMLVQSMIMVNLIISMAICALTTLKVLTFLLILSGFKKKNP